MREQPMNRIYAIIGFQDGLLINSYCKTNKIQQMSLPDQIMLPKSVIPDVACWIIASAP